MRVIAFKSEPYASRVSTILREQGYETEIIDCDGITAAKARELPEAVNQAWWARAFLVTNCESDHLGVIVRNNLGQVLVNRRPTGRLR